MSEHTRPTLFSKLAEYTLYGSLIVVPFFFLPFTTSLFDTSKLLVIAIATFMMLGLWMISLMKKPNFQVTSHPFTVPLALFISSFVLSVLFSISSSNFIVRLIDSLSSPLGTLTVLFVLTLLATQLVKVRSGRLALEIVVSITITLGILSVLQLFNLGPSSVLNRLFGFQLNETFQFSPAGSPLVVLTLLIATVVPTGHFLYQQRKHLAEQWFLATAGIMMTLLIVFLAGMLTLNMKYRPAILPLSANWSMAADVLKNVRTALVGVGPASFADAYNLLRPVQLNATPYWNVVFQVGSNTPLTLFVTVGLLGLISWILLAVQTIRLFRTSPVEAQPLATMGLTLIVLELVFPPSTVLLAVHAIVLALWVGVLATHHHPRVTQLQLAAQPVTVHSEHARVLPVGQMLKFPLVGLLLLMALGYAWFLTRITTAEATYYSSLRAIQASNGTLAYNRQLQMVRQNPYSDQYRRALSQTSFAIANSLSTKEDITDQDRQTIAQLLQQSVREARVATQLNRFRSTNWQNLAGIYRGLLGVTEGADQWTLASYVRAIENDPNNPVLRVELGGIFFAAQNYVQAEQLFTQAAQLKPDYANAYYNLGQAYAKQEKLAQAVSAYQKALELTPDKTSDGYLKADSELSELKAALEKQQAAAKAQAEKQAGKEASTEDSPAESETQEPTQTPEPNAEPQEAALSEDLSNEAEILDNQQPPVPNEDAPATPTPTPTATPGQ